MVIGKYHGRNSTYINKHYIVFVTKSKEPLGKKKYSFLLQKMKISFLSLLFIYLINIVIKVIVVKSTQELSFDGSLKFFCHSTQFATSKIPLILDIVVNNLHGCMHAFL